MEKHSSSKEKTKNKINILKVFLVIIICLVALFCGILSAQYLSSLDTVSLETSSNKYSLDESFTLENSENLLSTGVIVSADNDVYNIASTLKNTDTQTQDEFTVLLTLYDSLETEIANFSFSVSSVAPNGKVVLYTTSDLDLSDSTFCTMKIDN